MKKQTLFILIPFLLGACQQQEGVHAYHIQGTIDEAENGTEVLLQLDKEQSLEVLDRTQVQNHQFTFSGRQDSTMECTITYIIKGNKMGATFFLENGQIKMDLSNETSQITGTPNNNNYQQFLNKINAIYAQIGSAYNDASEEKGTEHEEDTELKQKVDSLNRKANELIAQTISENIANPVGYYLLCRFNQNLTAAQQESFINRLPIHLKRTNAIEDLKSQLSILPPDSVNTDTTNFEDFD